MEVVVTVPQPFGNDLAAQFGLRTTLGVLTELLASSKERVIIGAPFIQGEEGLHAGPLGMALESALRRNVRVDLISTGTSLAGLELSDLKAIAKHRLRTYQPRRNVEDVRSIGSHAKFCLADGNHAYVGSANLTQKGISGHLEMGVLLHGHAARQVWTFVLRLFDNDYLVEVPA
ncbi:MAG: phospholipase D family protein [Actinobacteria bacterium]|nr:phospholipase D family protein [Actinomycetota bacterium]